MSNESKRPEGDKEIQLYSLGTPNGIKVAWFLEEAQIPYDAHTVDIRKNVQFEPWFTAINPNSKIPAIIDKKGPHGQPYPVFESGAILLYLAKKYGKFLPCDSALEWEVVQWLFWQMAGFGPMLGQMGHFFRYAPEEVPYARKRYETEAKRLFAVLEKRLEGRDYIVGNELTIADFAIYPWAYCVEKFYGKLGEMGDIPNVKRYMAAMFARPALQRSLQVTAMH
jgi:GST-like protein